MPSWLLALSSRQIEVEYDVGYVFSSTWTTETYIIPTTMPFEAPCSFPSHTLYIVLAGTSLLTLVVAVLLLLGAMLTFVFVRRRRHQYEAL